MKRWRTLHRRRKTFLPAFNRKYWKRLIKRARVIVAEREKNSWPPKWAEFAYLYGRPKGKTQR